MEAIEKGSIPNIQATNPGSHHELNCLYICLGKIFDYPLLSSKAGRVQLMINTLDTSLVTQDLDDVDNTQFTSLESRATSTDVDLDADEAVAYPDLSSEKWITGQWHGYVKV